MKKRSALIRRAVLLAAIAVAIAVAVGLSVFFIIEGGRTPSAAQPEFVDSPWPALISGASALVAGILAVWLLAEKIMRPAMIPIEKLRDIAVSMAEGNLEERADETADAELGELGKSVNQLSYQLSRNMYTLIVERNRLRNMLNGLSEGIVAVNAEKRVTHTNPALGKLIPKPNYASYLNDNQALRGMCEICGKTTDLINAKIVDQFGTRYRKVCKECYAINNCQPND